MNLIAAVDKNRGIGKNGELLVSIPFDKQLFRTETMGKVVVMGRKTLESLPGGRPLEGRLNLVLSHNTKYKCKGATIINSMETMLAVLKRYSNDSIYIIGGESIYRQFMPYITTAHLTEIDYAYDADAFLPEFKADEWELAETSSEQTYFDLVYYFKKYKRIAGAIPKKEWK